MTGLDMVKGPHWSQILALFGQGGSHGDPGCRSGASVCPDVGE